jgi:hypothetical protein
MRASADEERVSYWTPLEGGLHESVFAVDGCGTARKDTGFADGHDTRYQEVRGDSAPVLTDREPDCVSGIVGRPGSGAASGWNRWASWRIPSASLGPGRE